MINLIRPLAITLTFLGLNSANAGFLAGSGKGCTISPMQTTTGAVTFVMSNEPIEMKITEYEMGQALRMVYQRDSSDGDFLAADGGSRPINSTLRVSRSGDTYMLERQTDIGIGGIPLYQQLQFQVSPEDFRNLKTMSMRSAVGQHGSRSFRDASCSTK